MRIVVLSILLSSIAIGLGVSIRAMRERRETETTLTRLAAEHDALSRNVTRERQRLHHARAARASLGVNSRGEAAEPASAQKRPLSPEAALANNQALFAEYLRCRREVSDWGSGHLFRAVGFSPEQIEQWKEMVAQDTQRRFDLIAAVEAQGLGRNSETFKTLSAENEKFRRAREIEVLGDLEPKYREYQRLEGTRSLVAWLTRTGVYSEEPITGEQIERATHILAANTDRGPGAGNGGDTHGIDWATTTAQLEGVLSPSQIATLQQVSAQYETINQTSRRVDERTKVLTAQFKSQPRR